MTPQQNARLHELCPQIDQLDTLGRALAEIEEQLRQAQELLVPWARQLDAAEREIQRLNRLGWSSFVALFRGGKQKRLDAAHASKAEAEQQIATAQEKLRPLREEAKQIEAQIDPLKPLREEYEQLLRTKEIWLKKQPEGTIRLQQLLGQEQACYQVFLGIDPALVAVHRVECALTELRHALDAEHRGDIGAEAVPLIKNLKEILINFGPAYLMQLPLVDRCYAYAAQSARLMLAQEAEGLQLLKELRLFGKQIAGDFLQARNTWQDAQRERIQYVENYPVR